MTRFKVVINSQRGREVEYDITESRHHDTAVFAAIEALHSFARHGHSRFPYNDHALTVVVEEIEEDR